jgi:hypothetical protein
MTAWLKPQGYNRVNPKRVRRLMRLMGLSAVYPKPSKYHKKYPYLLRDVVIERPDSGIEHRHNVYKVPEGLYISGGHNGLAEPVRAHMGGLDYAG